MAALTEYSLDRELGIDFSMHRMATWGPLAVFDAFNNEYSQNLYLLDLSKPTLTILTTANDPDVVWTPDVADGIAVWTEYHYERPGITAGAANWRIRYMDIADRQPIDIATGVHHRRAGGAAQPAVARVDGGLVAYATETADERRPDGWTIIIQSLADGHVVRTIDTEFDLYQFDLAEGNIVYSEGSTDLDADYKFATRLMISRPSDVQPVEVAHNAYDVAAGGDRFAWMQDDVAGAQMSPRPVAPMIMSATFVDPDPVALNVATTAPPAPPDWGPPLLGGLFPTATDTQVSWQDRQTDGTWDGELDRVVVWDATRGAAYQLEPTPYPVEVHLGGGWLVWTSDINPDHSDISHVVHGVALDSVEAGFP